MLLIKKGFGASTLLSSPSDGSRGGAMGACPPPLSLDQTESRKAKIYFLETAPLISGSGWPPPPPLPPSSEGLDLPLSSTLSLSWSSKYWSSTIRLFAFIMVISFTFISSMILVKQAVFPVPGAPEMYKLPGFPFGRWLSRNDLISAISFSRHIKLSGCEECSALLTLEYWWPLKIRVSNLLWCQFYFNNINLRMQDSWRSHQQKKKKTKQS